MNDKLTPEQRLADYRYKRDQLILIMDDDTNDLCAFDKICEDLHTLLLLMVDCRVEMEPLESEDTP